MIIMDKQELIRKLKNGEDVNLDVKRDEYGYTVLTWVNDRIDLTDSDLSGIDFSNKRLSYVDFTGSKLDGVKFNNCNIRTCKFDDCSIEHTSFNGAIIDNVTMDNVVMSETSFIDTEIHGLKITRGLIHKLDFSHLAKIKHIVLWFYDTEIYNCCFDNIQARIAVNSCIIKKCSFNATTFVDANSRTAGNDNFTSSYIEETNFNKAKFNVTEYDEIFTNSKLLIVNMYEADIEFLKIENASLRNVDISDAKVGNNIYFKNCSIVNFASIGVSGSITFDDTNLSNGIMTGMNASSLKFKDAYVLKTNFDKTNIRDWFLSMSTFKLCTMNSMVIDNLNVERPVAFLVDDESKFTWAKNKNIEVTKWVDEFDDN